MAVMLELDSEGHSNFTCPRPPQLWQMTARFLLKLIEARASFCDCIVMDSAALSRSMRASWLMIRLMTVGIVSSVNGRASRADTAASNAGGRPSVMTRMISRSVMGEGVSLSSRACALTREIHDIVDLESDFVRLKKRRRRDR